MIYMDNGATSFPKPKGVIDAVNQCLCHYCANPGRAGHTLSLQAGRAVYETREKVAQLFHIEDPLRVIFTSGATESLNLAIKGALKEGDHVITTAMEHNSVLRPLSQMKKQGVEVTILECGGTGKALGQINLLELTQTIKPNTKMVICNHVSNLLGTVMPIKEIGAICREKGLLFLVDASQSAGVLDLNVREMNIDLLAVAGHKSLLGIQGTGFLYVGERADLNQMKEGGTGSKSEEIIQPLVLPDRYESGTLNLPGIVSLGAGIDFIHKVDIKTIRNHEFKLMKIFLEGLEGNKKIIVYKDDLINDCAVIALNVEGLDSSEVAYLLDSDYGIGVRSGLHCAPLAHKTIGTLEQGAVRFSFGFFNTEEEVDMAVKALWEITKSN